MSLLDQLVEENKFLKKENKNLRKIIESQSKVIESQNRKIEELSKKVEELTEKLNTNSRNSSKSPSSDPYRSKKKKNLKPKKKGPKFGHKGFFRKLFSKKKVSFHKDVFPKKCPKCGKKEFHSIKIEKRQVTELPEITPEVSQYNIHTCECKNCKEKIKAKIPKKAKLLFGPRLMSFISLVTGEMTISKRKLKRLLEYFNIPISLGSIVNVQKLAGKISKNSHEKILEHIRKQKSVHSDETPWKTLNKKEWLWVASTKDSVAFKIAKFRNQEVFNKLFKGYKGILNSDRCPTYNAHKGKRQSCLAHIFRDFTKISERTNSEGIIGKRLKEELDCVFKSWNHFKEKLITRKELQCILEVKNIPAIKALLFIGSLLKNTKTGRTCANLLKNFSFLWTFIYEEGVEPTNNLAERDLRPAVIWRKLSFGTQSEEGKKYVEKILSIIGTMKKQEKNVFDYLTKCFRAHIRASPIPNPL